MTDDVNIDIGKTAVCILYPQSKKGINILFLKNN